MLCMLLLIVGNLLVRLLVPFYNDQVSFAFVIQLNVLSGPDGIRPLRASHVWVYFLLLRLRGQEFVPSLVRPRSNVVTTLFPALLLPFLLLVMISRGCLLQIGNCLLSLNFLCHCLFFFCYFAHLSFLLCTLFLTL